MGRRIKCFVATCCVVVVVGAGTAAGAASRPDPQLTPGAVDAGAAREASGTPCPGAAPSKQLGQKRQHQVLAAYRIPDRTHSAFVIDRLVPTQLGGTDARSNLWPLRRSDVQQKRAVETEITGLVCSGALDLATAQDLLRHDWGNAATLARQAVEQRKASLVAYLAALEQAERERLLAEYLASLPPPPPVTAPTPKTFRGPPSLPPQTTNPCQGLTIPRDPNNPTASPPTCPLP